MYAKNDFSVSAPGMDFPLRPFNRALEGVRAVAILSVVFYHAGVPGFGGGFVGVDVFFVLSGFLITSQLTAEIDRTGRIALAAFFARRARRLVPLGLLVTAVTSGIGWLLLPDDRLGELLDAGKAALFYAANIHFVSASSDYFGAMVAKNPLLHTWSLGIEAQFYLLWPWVLTLSRPKWRLPAILALTAASFGLCVILTPQNPIAAYYLLPSRLWELAAGAIVALLPQPQSLPQQLFLSQPKGNDALLGLAGLTGLALIAASVAAFGIHTAFPGYWAAMPVLGAAALIQAIRVGKFAWMGSPLPVHIGARSYAWYLWHWPIILFAARIGEGLAVRVAAAALSFALASLSHTLVEAPLRRWTGRALRPETILLLGLGLTILVYGMAAVLGPGLRR